MHVKQLNTTADRRQQEIGKYIWVSRWIDGDRCPIELIIVIPFTTDFQSVFSIRRWILAEAPHTQSQAIDCTPHSKKPTRICWFGPLVSECKLASVMNQWRHYRSHDSRTPSTQTNKIHSTIPILRITNRQIIRLHSILIFQPNFRNTERKSSTSFPNHWVCLTCHRQLWSIQWIRCSPDVVNLPLCGRPTPLMAWIAPSGQDRNCRCSRCQNEYVGLIICLNRKFS